MSQFFQKTSAPTKATTTIVCMRFLFLLPFERRQRRKKEEEIKFGEKFLFEEEKVGVFVCVLKKEDPLFGEERREGRRRRGGSLLEEFFLFQFNHQTTQLAKVFLKELGKKRKLGGRVTKK